MNLQHKEIVMLILDIIAIIIAIAAVYGGNLRYKPAEAKLVWWILLAAALLLMIVSAIIYSGKL